jgi:hypothetical protein
LEGSDIFSGVIISIGRNITFGLRVRVAETVLVEKYQSPQREEVERD